jgi:protein tyrosine phosphatase (PTP) superfamily phosphohydrolase (DUF442 family)
MSAHRDSCSRTVTQTQGPSSLIYLYWPVIDIQFHAAHQSDFNELLDANQRPQLRYTHT